MCLAVPAKVMSLGDDQSAVVDLHGNRVEVSVMITPDVVIDDWVLVHAGFAIQKLDPEEAASTWAVLEDLSHAAKE